MSDMSKCVALGLFGMFLKDGVDTDKMDKENGIMYITVPKNSFMYEECESISWAEDYVKRLKNIINETLKTDLKIKYRVKDITWTKEMGESNYNRNKDKLLDIN